MNWLLWLFPEGLAPLQIICLGFGYVVVALAAALLSSYFIQLVVNDICRRRLWRQVTGAVIPVLIGAIHGYIVGRADDPEHPNTRTH